MSMSDAMPDAVAGWCGRLVWSIGILTVRSVQVSARSKSM